MSNFQIKCIIVDDEQLAIDTLEWQLEEFCNDIEILHSFTNPLEAYEYLQTHEVDLCFLDIDMPELSGFEFINKWHGEPPFEIIFTTAYSEYAIKAFKVSAIDYLLKPIDEEDLISTVDRFKKNRNKSSLNDQLSIFMEQLNKPSLYPAKIALPTAEGVHLINVKDIVRLAAHNNYTFVHLIDRSSVLVSKTLKEVEKALSPDTFIRIHQSHTVCIDKIKIYRRGRGGQVTLTDDTSLPVSNKNKVMLMNKIGL